MPSLRDILCGEVTNRLAAPELGVECAAREACASHGNGVDAWERAVPSKAQAPTELEVAARVPA